MVGQSGSLQKDTEGDALNLDGGGSGAHRAFETG